MNPYKQQRETLNRLQELLTDIRIKGSEMITAITYNKKFSALEKIDVEAIRNERDTLKHEYNQLLPKLRIK